MLITFVLLLTGLQSSLAQLPHDAIYMPKKSICAVAAFGQSSWSEYWENTLKRDNLNIGTHIDQSYWLMAAAGITDRLNVLVSLPYITTRNTKGNLLGQKGLQDLTVQLKYKFFDQRGLSVHGGIGVSSPMSNYVADFLPMSIGLHSTNVIGRINLNYLHQTGLYLTVHGAYIGRSAISVDRDAYQAYERVNNTNKVPLPNVTESGVRLGFLKPIFQAEVFLESSNCIGGDAMRRNDMPFPTNDMVSTAIGSYIKVQPKNLGFNLRVSQVMSGKNAGLSLMMMAGILYQFNPRSKVQESDKPQN